MAEGLNLDASLPCSNKMNKRDLPCSLCRQYVPAIRWLTGRYYGLLENCLHPFCIFCIRGFNGNRLKKFAAERSHDLAWPYILCPVCEKSSSCIVASYDLPTDPERKHWKFQAFRECMMNIPCPFRREGLAACLCPDRSHNFVNAIYDERKIFLDLA